MSANVAVCLLQKYILFFEIPSVLIIFANMKMNAEQLLERRIRERFNKGVVKYGLIEDGDKILVGVSGGKDSLALLEFMAKRARIFKPHFSVEGVYVKVKNVPYKSDESYLKEYASHLGVRLHVYETSFDESTDNRHSHCFLCSWNRRKMLFKAAKDTGCNKIALGHHMDDILQTLLMNMTFHGSFSTMPPALKMNKFDMAIIRPLCLVREQDLQALAAMRGFRKQVEQCPYEEESHRADMKQVLAKLVEMNPDAYSSMWNSLTNIMPDLLPQ